MTLLNPTIALRRAAVRGLVHGLIALSLLFGPMISNASGATGPVSCAGFFRVPRLSSPSQSPSRWLQSVLLRADSDSRDLQVLEIQSLAQAAQPELFRRLSSLGPAFTLLILHPGVVARADRFLSFMDSRPCLKAAGAARALEEFRLELGAIRLYRALVLDARGVQSIRQHGLIPNFIRSGRGSEREMYLWLLSTGLGQAVSLHMHHSGAAVSPFLSYSEQAEFARFVARFPPGSPMARYVFQVEVDTIDVIYLTMSGSLIEEALVFSSSESTRVLDIGPEERYRVDLIDFLEDRRAFGLGRPLIRELDRPFVPRPTRR